MIKRAFFAGALKTQTKWLNKIAAQGFRLTRAGMLEYEFEPCTPGQYQYCVEYVGHLPWEKIQEYKAFLEEMGYRVWYKNINLNYATGKIYLRPGAEKGGLIGTSSTTLNKELLIVEKVDDGTPFLLRTTNEDRLRYTINMATPWIFIMAMFLILGIINGNSLLLAGAAILLIPVLIFLFKILKLKKAADHTET